MLPFWSPTTVRAAKLKRRPPLTTFAQRLMKTTFSIIEGPSPVFWGWSRRLSRRGPRMPPPNPPRRSGRFERGSCAGAGAAAGAATGAGATAAAAGIAGDSVSLLMGFGSEYKAGLAGGVREDLDLAVVAGAAPVEDDRGDAGRLRLLGKRGAEHLGPGNVGPELLLAELRVEA